MWSGTRSPSDTKYKTIHPGRVMEGRSGRILNSKVRITNSNDPRAKVGRITGGTVLRIDHGEPEN